MIIPFILATLVLLINCSQVFYSNKSAWKFVEELSLQWAIEWAFCNHMWPCHWYKKHWLYDLAVVETWLTWLWILEQFLSAQLCNVESGWFYFNTEYKKKTCRWIFKILPGFLCYSAQLWRCYIFCLEQSDNIQLCFSEDLNFNQERKNALGNKN